jgi:uncharacterized protein YciI
MRLVLVILLLANFFACKNTPETQTEIKPETNNMSKPVFDSVKAANYGADEYGMKQYVMAFLRKGSNRPTDKAVADSLQKAHLDNISRMADEGKLVVAGPFLNDGDLRGIYIFNVATIEEAKQLTETDPAIIAGSLTMELIPWYSSAALVEINELHKTLAKKSF